MALSRTNKQTIKGFLKEAQDALTFSFLNVKTGQEIGERVRNHIKSHTQAGQDQFGRTFAPYKPRTKVVKRKKKQRIRPPSLTDTEDMLQAMAVRSDPAVTANFDGLPRRRTVLATVYFSSRTMEQRAYYAIRGSSNREKRDFFGVTPAGQVEMRNSFVAAQRRLHPKGNSKMRLSLVLFRP